MTCTLRESILPKPSDIRVNGVTIPRAVVSRELQYHASKTSAIAWQESARALVVRELLLQEARRLNISGEPTSDDNGRTETQEEALVRALIEHEVRTPEPDEETCRRYYDNNRSRFRAPDIYEAAHILFAASKSNAQAYQEARTAAEKALAALHEAPDRFAELARLHSACPSAAQDGNLGQITAGQTTGEFERVLFALAPGQISRDPIATRYGFHIIRLDSKHEGRELPFGLVAERIAGYLRENVRRRACAQYIARLAAAAQIEGIDLNAAERLHVI